MVLTGPKLQQAFHHGDILETFWM